MNDCGSVKFCGTKVRGGGVVWEQCERGNGRDAGMTVRLPNRKRESSNAMLVVVEVRKGYLIKTKLGIGDAEGP